MIFGQWRLLDAGLRQQVSWLFLTGSLGVLGAHLVFEPVPQARGTRVAASVIPSIGAGSIPPPTPPKVTLLNPKASAEVHTAVHDIEDFVTIKEEPDDDAPKTSLRVRPSKAVRFRTWCVRLCDGFYYPMNRLTTRGRLRSDAEKCRSSCSSEARLYVNAILGRQAAPLADLSGRPYSELPTAFAYRRAVHPACTCEGSQMVVTSATVSPEDLPHHVGAQR